MESQQAQRGNELNLPILFDQRDAAIQCLRPLAILAPFYFVQGTEYYGDWAGDAAEEVEKALNAVTTKVSELVSSAERCLTSTLMGSSLTSRMVYRLLRDSIEQLPLTGKRSGRP